jgi:hypothetical protein
VLAAEVQRLAALLESLEPLLERILVELVVSTQERRQTNEHVERLARQHVELRRDLGRTDLHVPARYTRRRPLG